MRVFVLALSFVLLSEVMAAAQQTGVRRWCMSVAQGLQCNYDTLEQCSKPAGTWTRSCFENPEWLALQKAKKSKSRN